MGCNILLLLLPMSYMGVSKNKLSASILSGECFLEKELKFSIHEVEQSGKPPHFFIFPRSRIIISSSSHNALEVLDRPCLIKTK